MDGKKQRKHKPKKEGLKPNLHGQHGQSADQVRIVRQYQTDSLNHLDGRFVLTNRTTRDSRPYTDSPDPSDGRCELVRGRSDPWTQTF